MIAELANTSDTPSLGTTSADSADLWLDGATVTLLMCSTMPETFAVNEGNPVPKLFMILNDRASTGTIDISRMSVKLMGNERADRRSTMIRTLLAAALALLTGPAVSESLTLTNIKEPIVRASGKRSAKTTKELWAQIASLPDVAVPTPATTQPMAVTPIASNIDTAPLIGPGYGIPKSMAPDVVGAFRFICGPGQMNYDDPILYPGQKGGSQHLHQWYGNTDGNHASTYASLRTAGDSTCSNMLNRSAYWIPALFNGAGKVIVPDYMSIYYKRRPDGDPECLRMAAKGCVGLPTGVRVVSGYDMKRMGQAQPENMTFHFRCISPGKPSEHRRTFAKAVTDCDGAGQIMAAINFGSCWNGELDSADHRSHLTQAGYGSWGYLQCPSTYPYVLPELTQGIVYTIEKSDGDVWLASDRMSGMVMAGGSTFHADYMEAWDPPTRAIWERECIGKLRDCSDGVLGDGRMLKRGPLPVLASPRLVSAPAR